MGSTQIILGVSDKGPFQLSHVPAPQSPLFPRLSQVICFLLCANPALCTFLIKLLQAFQVSGIPKTKAHSETKQTRAFLHSCAFVRFYYLILKSWIGVGVGDSYFLTSRMQFEGRECRKQLCYWELNPRPLAHCQRSLHHLATYLGLNNLGNAGVQ